MANTQSTFSSTTHTSTTTTINGTTRSASQTTYSNPQGTQVQRSTQESGQPRREEKFAYDNAGRLLDDSKQGRIEDVTEREQEERDREFEERMVREYGGK